MGTYKERRGGPKEQIPSADLLKINFRLMMENADYDAPKAAETDARMALLSESSPKMMNC